MGYRSNLEAKVARKTTRAIKTFDLIEDGDRIMIGLSGGKDPQGNERQNPQG